MGSEIETAEQRLKSFMSQLRTECGIFERLVYKHKNQHRRCSYFQYMLKVRRDLKLLKLANLEEILDSSFIVISGNRPKQKFQLLESLKRKRSGSAKYNFLERLVGVARLLSQMVEPLLKAAMYPNDVNVDGMRDVWNYLSTVWITSNVPSFDAQSERIAGPSYLQISILLAQSFFMKFSVTTLAVLARIRVLVQQILLDAVLVYNTVSSLSQKEQTVKLNQEGFQVFREYYPRNEKATTTLECIWQTDKYVLVEKLHELDTNSPNKDGQEDISLPESRIQYESIEVLLGVGESEPASVDPAIGQEDFSDSMVQIDEQPLEDISERPVTSTTFVDSSESTNSSAAMTVGTQDKMLFEDGSCTYTVTPVKKNSSMKASFYAGSTDLPYPKKHKKEVKKKVAFVSVKPPAPSTGNVPL